MLMAAGLGTRLRPFTELEPKALLPILGVPMAQFAIDSAIKAGVSRVVANVHHHADKAREGLEALDRQGAELVISDESSLLLGSAGGIRKALSLLVRESGGPFFLLNADVLCDVDLSALALAHARLRASHGVRLTLTVFERPPKGGQYREILLDQEQGLIRGLGEVTQDRPYFVGAAVIEPEAIDCLPEGPLEFVPSILVPAIEAKKAGAFIVPGASGIWYDIGSPALWLESHIALIKRLETGRLPLAWRRRLERMNRRIASEIWVSKDSSHWMNAAAWAAPCYWSAYHTSDAHAPRRLGPRCVVYGASLHAGFENGIGFKDLWVSGL